MEGIAGSSGITSQTARIDFLQLLTTQLRNQDPIDPVDQQGLVNDLTQFSQLEGLENLNDSFQTLLRLQELTHGASLVGQQVTYQNTATGEVKIGVVDETFSSEGNTRLLIGTDSVSIDNILSIRNQNAEPANQL